MRHGRNALGWKWLAGFGRRHGAAWHGLQELEGRLLLSGDVVISEFLADNVSGLADGDGDHSDWIEIENRGPAAVNLEGWGLSDLAAAPFKWVFPAVELGSGERLLVWASGKAAAGPVGELHTNFRMEREGEYLGLTQPGGMIATEFAPTFPPQEPDISYGLSFRLTVSELISPLAPVAIRVPADGSLGVDWTGGAEDEPFDDSASAGWIQGQTGVGFGAAAPMAPSEEIIGNSLVNRPATDGASGSIFVLASSGFTQSGTLSDWSIFSNTTRTITPMILQPDGSGNYLIRGIGQSRVSALNGGAQTFAFNLQQGSAQVGPGFYLGWKDGGAGVNNTGVAPFTDNTADQVRWFNQHTNYAMNENLGTGLQLPRTYSIQAKNVLPSEAGTLLGNPLVDGSQDGANDFFNVLFDSAIPGVGTVTRVDIYTKATAGNAFQLYLLRPQPGGQHQVIKKTSIAATGAAGQRQITLSPAWDVQPGDLLAHSGNGGPVFNVAPGSVDNIYYPFILPNEGQNLNLNASVQIDSRDYSIRFLYDGPVAPVLGHSEIIGPDVQDRPLVDTASGSIFVLESSPISQRGRLAEWWFHSDTDFDPVRSLTPLLLEKVGASFVIRGVGQTRVSDESGLQRFDFNLQSGSDAVGPGFYLGWKDGANGANNAGVIEWTDGSEESVRWFGGDHLNDLNPGGNLGGGQAFPRAYSLQGLVLPSLESLVITDISAAMRNVNASAYLRVPFNLDSLPQADEMRLGMHYEDGFVAYLNGVEVARRNAPAGTPGFNAAAAADRAVSLAGVEEIIDLSAHLGLLRMGENILAIHGLNSAASSAEFLIMPRLELVDTQELGDRYLLEPTPGRINGEGVLGFVGDTMLSIGRGFYSDPLEVAITSATPDAQIYYTLDGSAPHADNPSAILYSAPVPIAATTTLRARAFKEDHKATNVDTQTYLFAAGVASQPLNPAGYPAAWSGAAADYGIDANVVNNAQPGYGLTEAILSLPAISLTADIADLFGSSEGIYYNSSQQGAAWERAASIELIHPDALAEGFQIDAGIRISGASSRNSSFTPKHSFRLLFKDEYGPSKLQFPLFADSQVEQFDQLVLRAASTDSWPVVDGYFDQGLLRWDNNRATYIRDQWMRDAQLDMGQESARGTYVNLFINGMFWGVYNLAERLSAEFHSEHLGGPKDEYDVIKDYAEVQAGDRVAWDAMMNLAAAGLSTDAAFQRIQGNNPDGTPNPAYPVYLDVPNLIDYMILHIASGAEDWPGHNYWASRRRGDQSEGFRFFVWDQEISNDSLVRTNSLFGQRFELVSSGNSPAFLYDRLRQNPAFRQMFSDRVHAMLFNDGPLSVNKNIERWRMRATEIDQAIVGESARWGDVRVNPAFTREGHWLPEIDWVADTYFPQIHAIALQRFRNVSLYPTVSAPSMNINGQPQHGGAILSGDLLTLTAPAGQIFYTLDGSDPMGAQGLPYLGGIPLAASTEVRTRALVLGQWSALTVASFAVPTPADLRITEIHYNAAGPSVDELLAGFDDGGEFEFIEITNVGLGPIDLAGVSFIDGVVFDFAQASIASIAPGQRVLIAENSAALQLRHGPGLPIIGQFTAELSNGGERLALADSLGNILHEVTYEDLAPWPDQADGLGPSLQLLRADLDHTDPANWTAHIPTPGWAIGDIDRDGDIDAADIDDLHTALNQNSPDRDLNSDALVDSADSALLVIRILQTFFGDASLDRQVSIGDLTLLAENFGGPGGWASGDFTGDGQISIGDLTLLAENFGLPGAPLAGQGDGDSAGLLPAGLQALGDGAPLVAWPQDGDEEEESENPILDILAELGAALD